MSTTAIASENVEATKGVKAAHLHGQPCHHAHRSARAGGDAAVLHREVRQCGQPQPRVRLGRRSRPSKQAREQIAKLIGANTKEIIFTSGATESDNLAIKGVAEMYREKGNHIITQATEHKAVLDTCKRLEKYGFRVTYLPVQKDGRIDLDDLKRAMDDKTILVTIMAANNEIGVLQPIREIGALCHERGVLFHTDAVQAIGKVPFNVDPGQRGPGFDLGAQALRPEGRGRAVRAPQESARATGGADRRRRPRARHAFRHAERPRHRRAGQGLRDRQRRHGRGSARSWRRCAIG